MKSLLAFLLALAVVPCRATTTTPDFSDLWYNPDESGWGMNVIQQDKVLFVTMFVYGSGGAPTWFVGSDVEYTGTSGPSTTFSGTLYRTSGGAIYSAPNFDPRAVTNTPVGTITFSAFGSSAATVTYTVDGASVTRNVQRQTWRAENISGDFLGASTGTWSNCGSRDGYQEYRAAYSVRYNAPSVQIIETTTDFTCNYTGTYEQAGRMGTISGNVTCTDNVNVPFLASDVQVSPLAISMRMTISQPGACVFGGRMGGMRRAP